MRSILRILLLLPLISGFYVIPNHLTSLIEVLKGMMIDEQLFLT